MTTHRSSVCDTVSLHLQSILYCVCSSVRFNFCYRSGTLKRFKSNQTVSVWLNNDKWTKIYWCSNDRNQQLWIRRGKKEIKREKNFWSGSRTQKMTISSCMQRRSGIVDINQKWRAGLWLHQCYCPQIVNLLEKVVCADQEKKEKKEWNLLGPLTPTDFLIWGLCRPVLEMGRLEGICLFHDGCGLFVLWKTDGA